MSQMPRYRVLADTFIAPNLIRVGSIIETRAPPGAHLEPLNEAAEAEMEKWYKVEAPSRNQKGELDGGTYRPHERFRRVKYQEADIATAEIISGPPAPKPGDELSLAELAIKKPTVEARPPAAKTGVGEPDPNVKVIHNAPDPSTVKKGV